MRILMQCPFWLPFFAWSLIHSLIISTSFLQQQKTIYAFSYLYRIGHHRRNAWKNALTLTRTSHIRVRRITQQNKVNYCLNLPSHMRLPLFAVQIRDNDFWRQLANKNREGKNAFTLYQWKWRRKSGWHKVNSVE